MLKVASGDLDTRSALVASLAASSINEYDITHV